MATLAEPTQQTHQTKKTAPRQLWIGIALVAVAWACSWFGPDRAREIAFIPLWIGYIFTVDGIVFYRHGSSLLSRSRREFALLFLLSAPLWWIFEFANIRLDNWHYIRPYHYSWLHSHIFSTIAFSTVLPAILETSDLIATTRMRRWGMHWIRWSPSRHALKVISAAGALLFAGSLVFSGLLFPFVWVGLFFALDPINRLRGYPSVNQRVATGDWSLVVMFAIAGLICGFFWEMWNFYSMPKWVYSVTYATHPRIFEMPLLGYGGYVPFALELYAAYHLIRSFILGRVPSRLLVDRDLLDADPKEPL